MEQSEAATGGQDRTPEEIERRSQATLRRMLATPKKPQAPKSPDVKNPVRVAPKGRIRK